MRSFLFVLGVLVLNLQSAAAATRAEIDALLEHLSMREMLEVMRDEGVAYSDDLANDMLSGGTGSGWQAIALRIHDPDKMQDVLVDGFEQSFADADIAPLLAFFGSEMGQRIVALELSARRAFLDQDVSDAAMETFRNQTKPYDAHLSAIEAYVDANDLIEYNVSGALNSNYMFYRGLAEGGALSVSDEDMLREVWSAEESTRTETRDWIFAFLMLAYEPLSVAEIEAYIALSETASGQALNRALFAGFDEMYKAISLSLGLALARQMQGESL